MYKDRKLAYDFKKPKQNFRITEYSWEYIVCKTVLAENVRAANIPLKHVGFWEAPSSMVQINNEYNWEKICDGGILLKN